MNDPTKQLDTPPDIDRVLTRFFRSEMPDPWPACPVTTLREQAAPGWFRSAGRFVLAASIVLFFLAYFTLAGLFPRDTNRPLNADPSQDIGKGFKSTPAKR